MKIVLLNGNINVYVDEEGKLHFVNGQGADSVLLFSNSIKYSGITVYSGFSGEGRTGSYTFTAPKPNVLHVQAYAYNWAAYFPSNETLSVFVNNAVVATGNSVRPSMGATTIAYFVQFSDASIGQNVSITLRENSTDNSSVNYRAIAIYYAE